ncbi:MAG: hypothetical protein ABIJ46_01065 [bacterium]
MVLVIDYRNGQGDVLLAGDGPARRFGSPGRRDGFVALAAALEAMGGAELTGVATVLPAAARQSAESMTWSSVRGAVAMANALAFAKGVPAVRIEPDDSDDRLAEAAVAAVASAEPDAIVSASYDGQPNITKPKS